MAFKEWEMWGYPSGVGGVECVVVVSQYPWALSDWLPRRAAWSSLLHSLDANTVPSAVTLMWDMTWATCEIQSLGAQVQTHPFYKKVTRKTSTTKNSITVPVEWSSNNRLLFRISKTDKFYKILRCILPPHKFYAYIEAVRNYSVQNLLSSSLLSKKLKIKIYRTIILPVVLYVCETWSLTLREERRLRVFENRVLRRVFGPKRDEVTGEWRKLHNEDLSDLYSLPNIVRVVKSRRMRWVGHVASMGQGRVVYRVLVGKPEGKRPLGRPRRRWEDNIKKDLQEVGGLWGLGGVGSG